MDSANETSKARLNNCRTEMEKKTILSTQTNISLHIINFIKFHEIYLPLKKLLTRVRIVLAPDDKSSGISCKNP